MSSSVIPLSPAPPRRSAHRAWSPARHPCTWAPCCAALGFLSWHPVPQSWEEVPARAAGRSPARSVLLASSPCGSVSPSSMNHAGLVRLTAGSRARGLGIPCQQGRRCGWRLIQGETPHIARKRVGAVRQACSSRKAWPLAEERPLPRALRGWHSLTSPRTPSCFSLLARPQQSGLCWTKNGS